MPKSNASTLLVAVLAVILAYPLSMGPVMRLAERGVIPVEAFDTIYDPLRFFVGVPGFVPAINSYLCFWEPHYTSEQAAAYPPEKAKPSAKPAKSSKP